MTRWLSGLFAVACFAFAGAAQAGFNVLVKQPMVDAGKVALIGYCFGGMVGVDFGSTARRSPRSLQSTARSPAIPRAGRRMSKASS